MNQLASPTTHPPTALGWLVMVDQLRSSRINNFGDAGRARTDDDKIMSSGLEPTELPPPDGKAHQ